MWAELSLTTEISSPGTTANRCSSVPSTPKLLEHHRSGKYLNGGQPELILNKPPRTPGISLFRSLLLRLPTAEATMWICLRFIKRAGLSIFCYPVRPSRWIYGFSVSTPGKTRAIANPFFSAFALWLRNEWGRDPGNHYPRSNLFMVLPFGICLLFTDWISNI